MFRNWGFLLGEIWVLLVLAGLLGVFVGWMIWGRLPAVSTVGPRRGGGGDNPSAGIVDRDRQIAALKSALNEQGATIEAMQVDLDECWASQAAAAGDTGEASQPERLEGPRDGGADDLKRIKGIGPQLETLCNELGFYHFDQIANWTPDEIAWVDENLSGFSGRVERDDWIAQAKLLAAGKETDFSKKVDKGNTY